MTRPLVIGVGNRYRGDDGAGPLAAARLAAAGIDAVEHPGDGPGLIEAWQGRESVVVIDAMKSVAPAGTVRRFDAVAAPLPRAAFQMSTHALGLADAIELARTLGRLPPRLVVYGIEGQAFATGTPPGPAVSAAVGRVVARVAAELAGGPDGPGGAGGGAGA